MREKRPKERRLGNEDVYAGWTDLNIRLKLFIKFSWSPADYPKLIERRRQSREASARSRQRQVELIEQLKMVRIWHACSQLCKTFFQRIYELQRENARMVGEIKFLRGQKRQIEYALSMHPCFMERRATAQAPHPTSKRAETSPPTPAVASRAAALGGESRAPPLRFYLSRQYKTCYFFCRRSGSAHFCRSDFSLVAADLREHASLPQRSRLLRILSLAFHHFLFSRASRICKFAIKRRHAFPSRARNLLLRPRLAMRFSAAGLFLQPRV